MDEKRIVMKLCHNGQIRRINLVERPLSIREVQQAVSQLFPTEKAVQLTYNDEDGDKITVSTNLELEEAYNVATESSNASIIRLNVETKEVDLQGPHPSGSLLCMSFVDLLDKKQRDEEDRLRQEERRLREEARESAKREAMEEEDRLRHEERRLREEARESAKREALARMEAERKAEAEAREAAKREALARMEAERKAEEEAREEAKQKAEALMRKAEEARLEEAKRKVDERRAEEARLEAKQKAEEEASRRLEEELMRLRIEADRQEEKKKLIADENRRKMEEEAAAQREAQKKREEEEALHIEKALADAKKAFDEQMKKDELKKAAVEARKKELQEKKEKELQEKKEKDRQQYLATHPAREKGLLTLTSMGFEADACWEALTVSRDNIEDALDKLMA